MPNRSFVPGNNFDRAAVPHMGRSTGASTQRTDYSSDRRHQNRVLSALPRSDFAVLARHLRVVSLMPGTVLQHQDQPLEYVDFPHEGLISLLAITPDGQTIEAASIGRGGTVCPVLKADACECFLTATALGAMHVSRIGAADLQTAQRKSETLSRALRGCREALLLQLRQNIVCGGLHPVEHRLVRWLLEAADRLETEVAPIPVTQQYVAQRLGVRRTTVTLVVTKLQDFGAIRWARSRVEIMDRAMLEPLACSCYAALRERTSTLLAAHSGVQRS